MSETRGAAANNCAETHELLRFRVSLMRQLPSPVAVAWLFDLGEFRGPWIVVLRDHEDEARGRLAEHLVELGMAADVADGLQLLAEVVPEHAGVVW